MLSRDYSLRPAQCLTPGQRKNKQNTDQTRQGSAKEGGQIKYK